MAEPEKMKLESMNVTEEKRKQLKALFPEVFNEHGLDFDQLKRVLGEWVEPVEERFGLHWSGKAKCMRIIQQPSIATLKPLRDESVNFDDTNNLFIEGDNLEVLKLLQKSYFGKVKMIYIDPPYNTGKEFIYPDKYSETLQTYLEYTGQKDAEGRKFSTNTETQGRYHSRWLTMMYPRLYLARNLLTEDGVIFISIDDNEVAHLRALCNLIFGEENFVAELIWRKKTGGGQDSEYFAREHEYIIGYRKTDQFNMQFRTKKVTEKDFNKTKNGRKCKFTKLEKWGAGSYRQDAPSLFYPITTPDGDKFYPSAPNGDEGRWRKRPENLDQTHIHWEKNKQNEWKPYEVEYFDEAKEEKIIKERSIFYDIATTTDAAREQQNMFRKKLFDNSKPTNLIYRLLQLSTQKTDIVLDFFAGSATTAHAVMELNKEDGGNRQYIMVQLPEPCDEKSEALEAGHKTIADVGKERIRRAADKIQKEHNSKPDFNGKTKSDFGLKVFKLAPSNFKVWESDVEKIEDLEQQLSEHINHIMDGSMTEDILYELLLRSGYSLTVPIEKLQLAGKDVFSVAAGELLICLDKELTQELIDAIVEKQPRQVICLDEGFRGNDQLKINAVHTFKIRAQQKESEMVFRTV